MSSVVVQPALPVARRQRWFWFGSAMLAAVVVFVGFSPTFYLKPLFSMPGELTALRILHGTVFSAWIALFVAQTWLVATDRRDLHRMLGTSGVVLLAAMCTVGYLMAIDSGRRGFSPDPEHVSALSFMVVPLFDLGVFVLLVAAALLLRRRSAWHKRLMLLATLSLLPPALARIALQFPPTPPLPVAFGGTALLIVGVIALDSIANRRLHPAMFWGGLVALVSLPGRIMIGATQAWQHFAAWLIA